MTVVTPAGVPVRTVPVRRVTVIPAPVARVFALVTAEDVLPKVLTGYGPLPAVVATSERSGPWTEPGSMRVVHCADGSTAREQVTHHVAPSAFAYRVWGFSHPVLRMLAIEARGQWAFLGIDGSTRVEWTYTFVARHRAAVGPLWMFSRLLWRGYMDACLENVRGLLSHARRAP